MIDFSNKTVVVSGVGPGLGRDLALTFAQAGADIVLVARTASYIEDVAAEVVAFGRRALCVPADITRPSDCELIAPAAVRAFGGVDVVVHNAYSGLPMGSFSEADLGSWRQMMEVNLFGALAVSQHLLPLLKVNGGSVVFINTQQIRRYISGRGSYAISKAALFSAAQVLAKELGQYDIRVNSVVVGWMDGPQVRQYFEDVADREGTTVEDQRAAVAASNALGIIPSTIDPAHAALFLASDLARSITGQSIDVNAGETFN